MRELKFKGKLLRDSESFKTYKKGIFITGGIYKEADKAFIVAHSNIFEVEPETVCQFTGLLDKNKDEIYEGDILSADKYPYQDEGRRNYDLHVKFIYGCWQGVMNLVNTEKRGISHGINDILDQNGEDTIPFKIIGNIYEGVSSNL